MLRPVGGTVEGHVRPEERQVREGGNEAKSDVLAIIQQ